MSSFITSSGQIIDIRPITEADAPAYRETLDQVSREHKYLSRRAAPPLQASIDFVRHNISSGNPHFVALHGSDLIGWCDICRSGGDFSSHAGALGIGLLAPWRGLGIGRRLMEQTIEAAQAAGIARIELDVYANNANAIHLYEQLGFAHEGRQRLARLYRGRYDDILQMALIDEPMVARLGQVAQ